MSDIGFSRKVGDGTAARPQIVGTTATGIASATVVNLPAGLSNIAAGALLKALVVSQGARGATKLQTNNGTLTLHTNLPLKAGSELVLQIQSVGAQTRMVILSVDAYPRPPEIGQRQQPPQQAPASGVGHSAIGNPIGGSPLPNAGNPPAARDVSGTGPSAGKSGSPRPFGLGMGHRADAASEVRGQMTPGLVLPGRVVVGNGPIGAAPGAARPGWLTAGQTVTIHVLATEAEASRVPPAPSGSPPLRGTIASSAPGPSAPGIASGTPTTILVVGEARIALPVPPPGPPGGEVEFQILETRRPAPDAPPDTLHREFLRLATDWCTLKDTVHLLNESRTTSALAEAAFLPRPGAHMAAAILHFMAALKLGDIRAWLGDARTEHLAASTQGQLAGQLSDDFATMSRHAADTAATGWHALAVPVEAGARMEMFRLYYRRKGGTGSDRGDREPVHFVVEADLTRIGLFQLEGLVRPRQFDLVVHSATPLSDAMAADIRGIFVEALSLGDLGGTIRFHGGIDAPFSPWDTHLSPPGHSTAVVV